MNKTRACVVSRLFVAMMLLSFCFAHSSPSTSAANNNIISLIKKRQTTSYDKQAMVNTNVYLTCELSAYFGHDLYWRKLQGRLSDDSIEVDGSLIINHLNLEDSGDYECYTVNGRGSVVRLTVIDTNKHQRKQDIVDDYLVVEKEIDSNVQLNCQLNLDGHDEENSKIKWKKLDGKMSDYSRDYGSSLLIYYLTPEDAGYYECFLPNGKASRTKLIVHNSKPSAESNNEEHGSHNFNDKKLHHAEPSHIVESHNQVDPQYHHQDEEKVIEDHRRHEQEHQHQRETSSNNNAHNRGVHPDYKPYIETEVDSSLEIYCGLMVDDEFEIKWKRLNGAFSEYTREYGRRLFVYYIKEEDAGDYECYLENGQSNLVKLVVLPKAKEIQHHSSHDDRTSNNENVELLRQRNQHQQLRDHHQNDDHYYEELRRQHNNYNNNRNNNERQDSRERNDLLELRQAQHYDSRQTHVEKEEDEHTELECSLETDHEGEIKWKKLNGEFSEYTREHGKKLYIYYLKVSDSGTYECSLPNGEISRVFLRVNPKITHEREHEEEQNHREQYNENELRQRHEKERQPHEANIESELDSNIELTCGLSTDDEYSIKWRKHGGALSEYAREHGRKLLIYYLKEEDSGVYECFLPNGESNPVRLTVTEKKMEVNPYGHDSRSRFNQDFYEQRAYYAPDENEVRNSHAETEHVNDQESIRVIPSVEKDLINLKRQDSAENLCTGITNGHDLEIDWFKPDGQQILSNDDKFRVSIETKDSSHLTKVSTLQILRNNNHQYGSYECRITGSNHRTESVKFELKLDESDERYNQRQQPINRQTKVCSINEATCLNGQCIDRGGLCNGRRDCDDGSDENNCDLNYNNGACQPNEKPCRSGKCIQKIWFCDGEKDCDDGSDESTCPTSIRPGEMCKPQEFMCRSRSQCILKSFQCDKEFDCQDQSDEIGCEYPRITKNPVRHLTVRLGGTFKIECKAEGFPTPFINWRLNWGHVCEEPRCYSSNENGLGVFTVTHMQNGDQGAYSCEAINTEGRVFAVPDTIVEIAPERELQALEAPPIIRQSECGCGPRTTTQPPQRCGCEPPRPQPVESRCDCHNHSDDCTCSGRCLNCQHNTEGDRCQYCKPGFYGDATRGTPYDCTIGLRYTTTTRRTTTPIRIEVTDTCNCNGHSNDCTCGGFCLNCQHNTKGDKCQYCADGFIGDPTRGTPNDCVPIGQLEYLDTPTCNPHGTSQIIGSNCRCKYGVTGRYCDKCASRSFNLITTRQYKRGCLSCFCNGLEVNCYPSKLHYGKIESDFYSDADLWSITDRFTAFNDNLELIHGENAIEFNRFDEYQGRELYLLAPQKFKGNKLSSYGGNITLTVSYVLNDHWYDRAGVNVKNLDLRISGSRVNIYYLHTGELIANAKNQIVIPLLEENFKRYGDNGRVDREHMMMALSDISMIMVRASYAPTQVTFRLSDFKMDNADADNQYYKPNYSSYEQASSVEVCECPEGYTGLSCESCAHGYQRSNRGFYLGLCERSHY